MTTDTTRETWRVDDHPRRQYPRVIDARGRFVADCDTEEDARLIAAAPELLGALRDCRAVMRANGLGEVYAAQLADAAISKATGAPHA
jgi:hypothetical protein